MEKNQEVLLVQMGSVIGRKGGKVLPVLHFVDTNLMLAFLRDANTARSVTDVFRELRRNLGDGLYKESFLVILTDNESEFLSPKEIEYDERALSVSRIFYCDVGSPYEAFEFYHGEAVLEKLE